MKKRHFDDFRSKVALFTLIGNFCLSKWKPHWALIQVMPSEAASSNLCSLQGHWEPFFTKKILVYIWPWTWAVISKFPVLDTFEKKFRENNINWNYYVNFDVRICDAPIMFRDQQTLNNKWQFKSQQQKKKWQLKQEVIPLAGSEVGVRVKMHPLPPNTSH